MDLAAIDRLDRDAELLHRRDEKPVAVRRELARALKEFGAVHLRHPVVGADHLELFFGPHQLERDARPLGGHDFKPLHLEGPLERVEHERFVVDEEEAVQG